jgi:hypothetical protein
LAVETRALAPTAGDAIGVPVFPGDPIGEDLWRGTSAGTALALVRQLPAVGASPTLTQLAKRVLTVAATPPSGLPPGNPLLLERLAKLGDMGDVEALQGLLRVVPASIGGAAAARVQIDQHWLAGRTTEACAEVQRLFADNRRDAYWQKAQVACQALSGQTAQAVLGAQLLREQGVEDPVFLTLIEVLGGTRGLTIDKGATLTPIHLPLLRQARRDLTLDLLGGATPAVLRAVATNAQTPVPLRLAAAERAAQAGALSADAHAQIITQAGLAGADVINAVTIARADTGPRGRALLYRAAQAQGGIAPRITVAQAALDNGRAAGMLLPMAALLRPLLAELAPTPETAPLALNAIRGLASAGDVAGARRWIAWARTEGRADQDLMLAGDLAAPWARLTGADPLTPTQWVDWADAMRRVGGGGVEGRMALFLGLATALGDRPPTDIWALALGATRELGGAGPGVAVALMTAAAEAGRIGETILAAAIAVGGRPVGAFGPTGAPQIVAALRRVGLGEPARALALEAAATGGL